MDRTELYEGQTQCTRQISMEENDKEVCRRWSPIVRSDGGSKVGTHKMCVGGKFDAIAKNEFSKFAF